MTTKLCVSDIPRINELLNYDPDAGIFRWRIRRSNVQAGSVAGGVGGSGYICITIDKRVCRAHHIAWLIVYGEVPKMIDHIDRDKLNNAIKNLRLCTQSTNQANAKRKRTSTTGFKGIVFHRRDRNYQAKICVQRRIISLGYYKTPEAAHAAYVAAAQKYFGEFACSGEAA